jgi:hypothetical protein
MPHHDRAISETMGHMLIAFLVIVIVLLVVASTSGFLTKFLQNPALLVVTAAPYDTTGGHIIRLHNEQGDAVNLNGTSQSGGSTEISITLSPPSGSPILVTRDPTFISTTPWGPGQDLFIFPVAGSYQFKSTTPTSPLTAGDYTVQIIDARSKVLLHTLPVTIA